MNIKDTGEHLAAHALLEREIKQLHGSLRRSMDSVAATMDTANRTMYKVDRNVQALQKDFAVTQEKLEHVATDKDLSTAIATCQRGHEQRNTKPINWKGITALVTGIIAAIAAAVIGILQIL